MLKEQIAFADDLPINIAKINIRNATYNAVKKEFNNKSKKNLLLHLKNIILKGKYVGEYQAGVYGYHFALDGENVVVSKHSSNIVAAFVDKSPKVKLKLVENKSTNSDELDTDKVKMSEHALLRAKERFSLEKEEAVKHFRSLLKKAKKIGIVYDKNGVPSVLFAIGRVAMYLNTELSEIKTVRRQEMITYEPVKNKFQQYLEKELRKLNRTLSARQKQLYLEKLKGDVKIAQLRLRAGQTRYESVRLKCKEDEKEVHQSLQQLRDEVKSLKEEIRRVSNSIIPLA